MYPRQSANTLFIPSILDQFDVLTALGNEHRQQRGRVRPEYVVVHEYRGDDKSLIKPACRFATAVFIAYIRAKIAKGRSRGEISVKLQSLERGARQVTALPPSPLFPLPASDPPGNTSQLALFRIQSAYYSPHHSQAGGSTTQSPGLRRASTATSRPSVAHIVQPATIRPAEEGTEPPPPPYSRQDPEPEATAELTRQISQLTTGISVPAPVVSSTPVNTSAAERERRELEEALRLSREVGRGGGSDAA
ncbi:hypothetical protein QFC21_005601 [Naganishia friedmannii]|uniref:Uncharacterized protein n=1 Tax=Naganishia friedmannii TaxID=89922 RepID=A0ACC2V8K2_9TREE|nr:hypothetical protein QFC21_005601 [Naganishia friedmannii]